MLAKDIMTTKVITAKPETTIEEAMTSLVNLSISGLIVIDPANEVVGVVSEKDLLVAYDYLGSTKASIKDYVSQGAWVVESTTPMEEVSRILVQHNIKRVPVVQNKKLVGVISRRDILRHILKTASKV